jgi:hypothetical protein
MNLTDNHKKFLLVFGGGFLLFLLFKPKRKKITAETNLNFSDDVDSPKDRKKITEPTIDAKEMKDTKIRNSFGALKGYIDAYNNGEPKEVLDKLNREFAKEFKCKVYQRKSDGKLVVCDLSGKEILVNN